MVLGAGTLGLCVIAALRALCLPGVLVAVAKHPNQRKLAHELGADQVVKPGEHKRAARRLSGSLALESGNGSIERLTGGVDLVVDCVGTSASLEQCLQSCAPAAGSCSSACRAWSSSTSLRFGNARSSCAAPTLMGVRTDPTGHGRPSSSPSSLCGRRASSASSRRATRSNVTRTPSRTPPQPGVGAR